MSTKHIYIEDAALAQIFAERIEQQLRPMADVFHAGNRTGAGDHVFTIELTETRVVITRGNKYVEGYQLRKMSEDTVRSCLLIASPEVLLQFLYSW